MTGTDGILPRGHGVDDLMFLLETLEAAKAAGVEYEFLDWFLGEYNLANRVHMSAIDARTELDF